MAKKEISKYLLPRKVDSHKGDYGHVFVLAGSTGFTGAAYLCSQAAILSGSGLVTLGIPESLNPIMEVKLTEVMTKPLPETGAGTLSKNAFSQIVQFAEKADAVALGPGLSTNPETQNLIRKLITAIEKPLVIDADGLNALSGRLKLFKGRTHTVITPHPGEMARLLTTTPGEIQKSRKKTAQKVAVEYNLTVVLKGYQTVVACPSGKVYVNNTGNPGMASGGTGDVLTGIIVSFLGQGIPAFEAAKLAVYIHGFAGDLAAKEKGEIGLIAVDILNYLPAAFKKLV